MKKYVLLLLTLACAGDPPRTSGGSNGEPNAASLRNDSARRGAQTGAQRDAAGSVTSDSSDARARDRRTILFAGTSLTAGYGLDPDSAYPQQLQRLIDDARLPYDVVNAGVSGETSSALLSRLGWLLREPFDILVIETGANDGLRGIPVATMERNIQQIVERARAARPGAQIALMQMEALPNLGATYTREFRDAFPRVARSQKIVLLPFLLEGVAGIRELNQGDGIHPNYAGERILVRNVWKGLRPLL